MANAELALNEKRPCPHALGNIMNDKAHTPKAADIYCTVDSVGRRKDFSATLRFSTERECGRELYHDLIDLQGVRARVIIAPDGCDPKEDMSTDEGAKKPPMHPNGTPSQRLRAVLYRRWENSTQRKEGVDADTYYKRIMLGIIEEQKERI